MYLLRYWKKIFRLSNPLYEIFQKKFKKISRKSKTLKFECGVLIYLSFDVIVSINLIGTMSHSYWPSLGKKIINTKKVIVNWPKCQIFMIHLRGGFAPTWPSPNADVSNNNNTVDQSSVQSWSVVYSLSLSHSFCATKNWLNFCDIWKID